MAGSNSAAQLTEYAAMRELVRLFESGPLTWAPEDVCTYLRCLGFPDLCDLFRRKRVGGSTLIRMTPEKLCELGVPADDCTRLAEHVQVANDAHMFYVVSPTRWEPDLSPRSQPASPRASTRRSGMRERISKRLSFGSKKKLARSI